jgi:DNA-binding transcriptional regulator YdaS (Cro superfamily)
MNTLDIVLKHTKTKTKLAKICNISKSAVGQWGNVIPARFCPTIERVTGIPCETLNPSVEWRVLRESNEQNNSETQRARISL